MSLENSLDRIIALVDDSHEKVKAKGGTTSTPYLLANLPDAIDSIPKGITPTGTKTITENGTHDVTNYASAKVEVAGEDVTTETNAYTTELAELTTAVTALEEELAGKAAGGGAVETCTVTVVGDTGGGYVIWSSYVDGQMLVNYPQKTNNHIYENVVCGSCFILSDVMYLDASATDGSIIAIEGMRLIYQAPETPNVNAVLTVTRD